MIIRDSRLAKTEQLGSLTVTTISLSDAERESRDIGHAQLIPDSTPRNPPKIHLLLAITLAVATAGYVVGWVW